MENETTAPSTTEAEEIEKLKKLQKLMAALEHIAGDNWFISFLQMLLGGITGYDPDQEGVDGARTAEEEKAGERDYEGRRASEERDFEKYKKPERFIPQSMEDVGALRAKLQPLKEKYGAGLKAILPVRGEQASGDNVRIASDYGDRVHPITGKHKHHDGLDITPLAKGSKLPIVAPMPGVVTNIQYRGGYGLTVDMIDINGVTHRFAHLSAVGVKAGDVLDQGEALATMGTTGRSTGVHLHYEQFSMAGGKKVSRAPEIAGKTWHEGEKFADASGGAHTHGDEHAPKAKHAALAPANTKHASHDSVQRAAVAAISFKVPPADKDHGKDKPPAPSGVFAYASAAFSSATKVLGLG